MKTLRFIEHFGLENYFNIDKIQNINVSNSYNYVSGAEYCGSGAEYCGSGAEYCGSGAEYCGSGAEYCGSGAEYCKSKNVKINVKFSLEYSSEESYENRYNPYIDCYTSLNVFNTKDNKGIPVNFSVNGKEPKEKSWAYLLSKIIQEIESQGVLEFVDFN